MLSRINILIIILIILLAVIATVILYLYYQIYQPLNRQGQTIEFVIQPGESAKTICDRLQSQGRVRSSLWLETYLWFKGERSHIKAGQYQLSSSQNIIEISDILIAMPQAKPEVVITIPEGWRTEQIINKLLELGLADRASLTEEINNLKKYQTQYNFLQDAPADADLSGFLFPDTYRFYKDTDALTIVKRLLDNFDKKIDVNLRQEIARQQKSIFEVVTMASIVEKEVASDTDRIIAAGIFWQRLADNHALESCATIAYASNVDKWRYSDLDLQIVSPYNTYKNIGLPPGPICNPGLSAIKAAIYPTRTDYYYFLSAPDGQTIFSKTLEEHNKNKIKYLE